MQAAACTLKQYHLGEGRKVLRLMSTGLVATSCFAANGPSHAAARPASAVEASDGFVRFHAVLPLFPCGAWILVVT